MLWNLAILAALGALYFGFRGAVREHQWLRQARITHGTVIDLVRHRSSRSTTYRPRVQYPGADGNLVSFEGTIGSSPPDFQIGDQVVVADDGTPGRARIVTFGQRFGGWVLLCATGLLLLGLRVVFLVGSSLVPSIYLHTGHG